MVAFSLSSLLVSASILLPFAFATTVVRQPRGSSSSSSSSSSVFPPSTHVLDPYWDVNAPPQVREYNFTITERPGAPDGRQRTMFVVNGQFPGPLIEANKGDTIIVHVNNQLSSFSTALHWHGLVQNGSQWADGPHGVTQCGIPTGKSFTYRFKTDNDCGTYWWHAHSDQQVGEGLAGPFIIHCKDDPLKRGQDFDEEWVVMMADWFNDNPTRWIRQLLSGAGQLNLTTPDTALINGRGSSKNQSCPQTFDVKEGKRYRLRLINHAIHGSFFFSIDNHPLSIVEVDTTPVHPVTMNRIFLGPSQRYSAIVTANQMGPAFAMRAHINVPCLSPKTGINPDVTAVLRYDHKFKGFPNTTDWTDPKEGECVDPDDGLFKPVNAIDVPAQATGLAEFNISRARLPNGSGRWNVSGNVAQMVENVAPLLQVAQGQQIDRSRFFVQEFSGIQEVDIVINNESGAEHPMHFHTAPFSIIARGQGLYRDALRNGISYNLTNPLRRDVAIIPARSWAVFRHRSDVPGVWPVHCHYQHHLSESLIGLVVFQPEKIPQIDIPKEAFELCNLAGPEQGIFAKNDPKSVSSARRTLELPWAGMW